MTEPLTPLLTDERIAYQFCGSGDMPGGVQSSVNTVADYINVTEQADTQVFIGSADNMATVADNFNNFAPADIHVLGGPNHYIVANGSQNPIGSFVRPTQARSLLRETKPALLHIMAPWIPYVGGVVLRTAQKLEIPTVATYHIYSQERRTNAAIRAAGLIDKASLSRLKTMIAVSEPAEEHLRRYYGYRGKVVIIPNPIDIKQYEQAKAFESGEPFKDFQPEERKTIVFVGRPDERKGLGKLIESARQLAQNDFDFQLIVCGDGPQLSRFKNQVEQYNIQKYVKFLGRVSESDKRRWYASADLAVFPAKGGESQGLVLLEAMAAGSKVVLGGDNKGYRGVLGQLHHRDEVLFNANDVNELTELIAMISADPFLAEKIHTEQQALVRNKYDIRIVGRQIAELYKSLL